MTMLATIARTRVIYPRIQAWICLFASMIFGLSSNNFKLRESIPAILIFTLLAILPKFAPQNRINLRDRLSNVVYIFVKTAGLSTSFNFFSHLGYYLNFPQDWSSLIAAILFYLYILALDIEFGVDNDIGFSDGLIFSIHGQALSSLKIPVLVIQFSFPILIIYKHLLPELFPLPVQEEYFEIEDEFFDADEEFDEFLDADEEEGAITIDADYEGDDESDPNGDMNELFEFTDEIEQVEPLIANAVVAAEIPANAVPAVEIPAARHMNLILWAQCLCIVFLAGRTIKFHD